MALLTFAILMRVGHIFLLLVSAQGESGASDAILARQQECKSRRTSRMDVFSIRRREWRQDVCRQVLPALLCFPLLFFENLGFFFSQISHETSGWGWRRGGEGEGGNFLKALYLNILKYQQTFIARFLSTLYHQYADILRYCIIMMMMICALGSRSSSVDATFSGERSISRPPLALLL